MVRANVDSLMKLIAAFDRAGIELIGDGAASTGKGRGVRLTVRGGPGKGLLAGGPGDKAQSDGGKTPA